MPEQTPQSDGRTGPDTDRSGLVAAPAPRGAARYANPDSGHCRACGPCNPYAAEHKRWITRVPESHGQRHCSAMKAKPPDGAWMPFPIVSGSPSMRLMIWQQQAVTFGKIPGIPPVVCRRACKSPPVHGPCSLRFQPPQATIIWTTVAIGGLPRLNQQNRCSDPGARRFPERRLKDCIRNQKRIRRCAPFHEL